MTDFNLPEPEPPDPETLCPKLYRFKPLIDSWLQEDKDIANSNWSYEEILEFITAEEEAV